MNHAASQIPLLSIKGLSVAIGAVQSESYAVRDVSFDIRADEIVCIVGESGSGKSVTAHAVMGLLPKGQVTIKAGQIHYRGKNVLAIGREAHRLLRGKKLGMIFQEPMTALNPIMRVGSQVEEVLEFHTDMTAAQRRQRVIELFKSVLLPNPELIYQAYPFELSGGQRQRVMIAIALALEPDILIADEPTTALDVTTQAQILSLLKALQQRLKIGVMFITHDFGVVAEIADRIVVMRHGRVVEQGDAASMLNQPQHEYTRALLAAVPHLPDDKPPRHFETALLNVDKLEKTFGGGEKRSVHALQEVSLTLHVGETLGVVGESGSGKSTLGRTIVGLNLPDGGSLKLGMNELVGLSRSQFRPFRRDIQMVFQDPYASLNPRHRVGDAIAQGPIAFGVDPVLARQEAKALLELVGLGGDAAERYPHQFSGGQRQRIGIARALALKPKLLIADEAVSALDVSIQAQVLQLLADISRKLNLAVLFITHDLRVAAQICDRIAVMQLGRVVELGNASDIFYRPQHPYTKQLIDSIPGKSWRKPGTAATV